MLHHNGRAEFGDLSNKGFNHCPAVKPTRPLKNEPRLRNLCPMNILCVIPIFNDWASFRQLMRGIEAALGSYDCIIDILAVDDGSSVEIDRREWADETFTRIRLIEIAQLACNLGHQKAIAVGLSIASHRKDVDAIVVMDGDGEDRPADLPRLLDAIRDRAAPIVLAHRAKRSEGTAFRFFYMAYKALFRRLTGVSLSFGNFCALTAAAAKRLTFMPNLWNSLPATCLRSKLPIHTVSTVRGSRYEGEPKMNFVGLVLHGMQAITVFSDAVLVRLSLAAMAMAAVAAAAVVAVRLGEFEWMVPGWASNMIGFLVLSLLTVLFGLLSTSLLTLQERSNMPMIPYLHAEMYVSRIHRLFG